MKPYKLKYGPSRYSAIVTVNMSEEKILGTVILSLKLQNFDEKVTFHVLRDSTIDIILGREFLHEFVDTVLTLKTINSYFLIESLQQ